MTLALDIVALTLAGIVLAHGAAWTLLAVIALPRPASARPGRPGWRFAVIVPAHNEEASVGETVRSLRAAVYRPAPEVLVVADNCTDGTATVAFEAGATVLVREDEALRGKSYALDFGLRHIEAREAPPDAYVVIDADTTVHRGFFGAIAARLDCGAAIIQGLYAVTPAPAPIAGMRALAFALVHYSRPLGAARLGLGVGLKGNGMVFRRDVLAGGFPGSGIAEDAAATVALARAGMGVTFEPRAIVCGAMAQRFEDAHVQDRRWEGGRLALLPSALAAALGALSRGRLLAFGSAADVAALPLTVVGVLAMAAMMFAIGGFGSVSLAVVATASVLSYPAAGWAAARVHPRELLVLLHAPRFVMHKLAVLAGLAVRGAPRSWERTRREARP